MGRQCFVRVTWCRFLVHHITCSVNLVRHNWGRRLPLTRDQSQQHSASVLALGVGWHTTLDAELNSVSRGLRWWQFDASNLLIRDLSRVGLAWTGKPRMGLQ